MRVTVRPRLQVEDWSLYWKESMRTTTTVLDDIEDLDVPDGATASDLAALAAARLGWRPIARHEAATRLEGFEGPMERCLVGGRLVGASRALADVGVGGAEGGAAAVVVLVRVELVAEGWKVRVLFCVLDLPRGRQRGGRGSGRGGERGHQRLRRRPADCTQRFDPRPTDANSLDRPHQKQNKTTQIEDDLGTSDDDSDSE